MQTRHDNHKCISVQIKGSDTMLNLIQALVEKNSKLKANVSITGGGSGAGLASLINATCDIAMSSRSIEKREKILAEKKNIKIAEFKIGLDGLAVLVNKNNPVDKLTLNQLKDIFMARITNWKEVGGEDRKIVILSRESNSGTHIFFKERVLRDNNKNAIEEFSVKSLMMPSSQTIYDEVFRNPNALGYVGIGFINSGVKALSIAVDIDSEYIYPTLENILNGTYSILRPLYLYTNTKQKDIIKTFINFVLSDHGQKIILETDFVPLKCKVKNKVK
ncbi:MAG: phosphate ABC transporter substrate-binding protein [Endomicrobium sp.]|nr:phosphate ABC transporter substrate-binding protein [Endomicrobium sp.]